MKMSNYCRMVFKTLIILALSSCATNDQWSSFVLNRYAFDGGPPSSDDEKVLYYIFPGMYLASSIEGPILCIKSAIPGELMSVGVKQYQEEALSLLSESYQEIFTSSGGLPKESKYNIYEPNSKMFYHVVVTKNVVILSESKYSIDPVYWKALWNFLGNEFDGDANPSVEGDPFAVKPN
ncbi:hypothetical protein P3T73_13105 [Kiritimatiellota bacterium B12222]|nr:hypothetical protein P3T73_13105 [Kiritimatiellota bacterium B12222]